MFLNFHQNLKGVPDPEKVQNPCLRLLYITNPPLSTPIYEFLLQPHELTLPGDKC